jgi:hypothetical protein
MKGCVYEGRKERKKEVNTERKINVNCCAEK